MTDVGTPTVGAGRIAAPPRPDPDEPTIRERLLRAAGAVIDEVGEERLTLAQVVNRAGLTTGAVYSNFSNREELVVEVYVSEFRGLIDDGLSALRRLLESDARGDEFTTGLRSIVVRPDDESNRRARWLRLRAVAATQRYERVGESVSHLQHQIASECHQMVVEAQARGDIDPGHDAKAIGQLIQQFAFALVLADLSGDLAPDPDTWVDLVVHLVSPLCAARL